MSRTLIITDVTGPGGVGTHIGQLALEGERRDWDVSVLMDDGKEVDDMARSLRRQGVVVERGKLYHGYHSEQVIRNTVVDAFRRRSPEVVHVQCGSPRSAVFPREVAAQASIPLIFTENY